jgi:hypothetical protein
MALCLAAGLTPVVVADGAVPDETLQHAHRLLRELDRFLDHHPLLENDLRLDTSLSADRHFLCENPDLRNFLTINPDIVRALEMEPLHLLHRALIREANAPLKYSEVAQLDPLFSANPVIERDLIEKPERIRDRDYLNLHPLLGDFLSQHPLLSRVFQPEPTTKS